MSGRRLPHTGGIGINPDEQSNKIQEGASASQESTGKFGGSAQGIVQGPSGSSDQLALPSGNVPSASELFNMAQEAKRRKADQDRANAEMKRQQESRSQSSPSSKPASGIKVDSKPQNSTVKRETLIKPGQTIEEAVASSGSTQYETSGKGKSKKQPRPKEVAADIGIMGVPFRNTPKPKPKLHVNDKGKPQGPWIPATDRGYVNVGDYHSKSTQQHGPGVPVNDSGVVLINPGDTPTAIVKRQEGDKSIQRLDGDNRLYVDPDRPRVVIPPRYSGYPMGDGRNPKLLDGFKSNYAYRAHRNEGEEELSDDEIIARSIKEQAENIDRLSMFPNEIVSENRTSIEDFEKDYREGRREKGRYKTRTQRQKRLDDSVDQIIDWIIEAFIPLESQYIDENGRIRFDEDVEEAIANYMNYMGFAPEQMYLVFQGVAKSLGLSPDRDNLFFNKDKKNFKLRDEIFIEALNNMMMSMEIYGHPYGLVNNGMFLGNTRCFPIGVVSYHEAEAMSKADGPLHGVDPFEIMSKAASDWVNETFPAIRKNVYRNESGPAQMRVIQDMVRSLCKLDGISPRKYQVSETIDEGFNEMMADTMPESRPDMTEEDKAVMDQRKKILLLKRKQVDRAKKRLDKKRNNPKQFYAEHVADENGVVIHEKGDRVRPWHGKSEDESDVKSINERNAMKTEVRNPRGNTFDGVCMAVGNMARFMGVVGNVPIMASGIVEHAQGNLCSWLSNKILFNDERYVPNEYMYSLFTTDEGIDSFKAWKALMQSGGQDAVIAYFDEGYDTLNTTYAKKFLEEFVTRKGLDNKAAKLAKDIAGKMNSVAYLLMPGDIGFQKQDARRWLEGFMLNNQFYKQNGGIEVAFTRDQVIEMVEADGVQKFLAGATSLISGRDAMLMTRNQTLARESPLTHMTEAILRSNGITNLFVTIGIDTYFTYGMNFIQLMFPYTNTFSYLAVRGVNKVKTGGVSNLDTDNMDILNYQMGGLDDFGVGLVKNIIYDSVKFGNIFLIAGVTTMAIAALGFKEPPDEQNKYKWSEYLIGGNLGWGQNGEGIPIYAAWWMNDLTLFGLPMAYAMNVKMSGIDSDDPELATKLFIDGCADMVNGAGLLDMMKLINKTPNDIRKIEEMMADPKAQAPSDWMSYGLMQLELFCARGANKVLVPGALKNFLAEPLVTGEYDFARSAYEVYDRDSKVPGKTESVKDWAELQRRIESKYNIPYALFNNITKNHYLFDDGSTDKTGYFYDEMPINTASDPAILSYWKEHFDFDYDPDNIPGGEENRIPYTESCIEKVLAHIDTLPSPEYAKAHHFHIPAELRFEMRDYLYQRINFAENLYNQRLQSGYYRNYNERQQGYQDMQNEKSKCYDYLNNWVFNADIPWSDKGYAQYRTSYMNVYYRKSDGSPASQFDMWVEGPDSIGVKTVPRGDHPSSIALFTTPDNKFAKTQETGGFNYETVAKWMVEGESGTDLDKVFSDAQGTIVPVGRDEGVPLDSAIFGGNRGIKNDAQSESTEYGAEIPTMGYRSYMPWDEKFIDELKNVKREDVDAESSFGEMGVYKDKSSWKTSSRPSYSSQSWPTNGKRNYGSYSSGGSFPKIYSNPRSVNVDRAATMRTQRPYGNVNTYLRPGFKTQGSRQAYSRQDL